ncbi:MAG TPA: nuclear transport factor 2 family protein [Clostridia bacterium]|nr:nuclear transport factor 2 family protein [Clostridia bacterium]
MHRDVEKVEQIYRAFGRRNLESALHVMAEKVEIIQSPELPWGGQYVGHDGVKQFVAVLTQHLDSRVVIERFIDAGEHIVAVGQTVGKARATNLEFEIPFVHVWTFHEGQVIRFQPYIDNATMLAALGS